MLCAGGGAVHNLPACPGQNRERHTAQAGVCTGLSGPSSLPPHASLASDLYPPLPIHQKFSILFPCSDILTLGPK